MNWHVRKRLRCRRGFTLIELLVAVTLTLVMMAAVVQIFAIVGESINNSRSTLEMSEQIRAAVGRLRLDLEGATADMTPPGRPEEGKGYFEYIEGPIGAVDPASIPDIPANQALIARLTPGHNTDEGIIDSTVGDRDDILQFTTRSRNEPFVGRGLVTPDGTTAERVTVRSQVAEVAWFLRGTTLYRRVLLVSPSFDADLTTDEYDAEVPSKRNVFLQSFRHQNGEQIGFYNNYDLSVHWDPNANGAHIGAGGIVCNTLADLTRRECRYAHPPLWYDGTDWTDAFPYALHNYNVAWRELGLPTLQECSHSAWPFPIDGLMPHDASGDPAVTLTPKNTPFDVFDAWVNPYPFDEIDMDTGTVNVQSAVPPSGPAGWPGSVTAYPPPYYVGPREGEDVILTNVLSFDVKAWDPRAPVLQAVDTAGATVIPSTAVLPGDLNYYDALLQIGGASAVLSRGAYVDLGYGPLLDGTPFESAFSGMPNSKSLLDTLRIYDTWSIHYEHDGLNQDDDKPDGTPRTAPGDPHLTDEGTDGFDNDGDGVVDDPGELEAPPPYSVPLRGIQIKIRVFEPDSRQVREVTIRHDFLNQ